jgi:hypothetical protein
MPQPCVAVLPVGECERHHAFHATLPSGETQAALFPSEATSFKVMTPEPIGLQAVCECMEPGNRSTLVTSKTERK